MIGTEKQNSSEKEGDKRMRLAEEITRTELERVAPVEDLIKYHEDYGFEFPIRAGHILNCFACDGLTVLGDRQ